MSTVAIISICSYFLNVSRRSLIDQNTKQVCPLSSDKKQWLLGVATKNKNKTELFLFISLAVETISATETIIERLGADNTDNESAIVVMWYQLSVSSNKPLLLHIVFLCHMRHDLKCYVVGGRYTKPWTLHRWKVSNREVTCGEDIMILWSLQLLQLLPATKMGVMTSAANRLIGEVVQSRRRPLLGPSPGWKRLLALSHLTHSSRKVN